MVMINAIRKIKLTTSTTHYPHQCFSTKQLGPKSAPLETLKISLLRLLEAYIIPISITTQAQITQKISISL